jgi:hypothetical protein
MDRSAQAILLVIPAQAGTQLSPLPLLLDERNRNGRGEGWAPAFAGVTSFRKSEWRVLSAPDRRR